MEVLCQERTYLSTGRVRFRWLEGQADAVVRIFCDDQLQVEVQLPGDLY